MTSNKKTIRESNLFASIILFSLGAYFLFKQVINDVFYGHSSGGQVLLLGILTTFFGYCFGWLYFRTTTRNTDNTAMQIIKLMLVSIICHLTAFFLVNWKSIYSPIVRISGIVLFLIIAHFYHKHILTTSCKNTKNKTHR